MVAKISIGSSLYGALTYNSEKINEAKGRVLGANKIVLPPDGNINIGKMVENFKAFMPKMGKTKKPVLHISLNPHPEDKLTDQDFEILAREYLDKLGFGEQPYILYKHEDIDRHHIHIVKITTELEEKYGLHKAQREKISPDTPITKIDLSGDIKRQVQNTVKLVGMRWKFQTLGEFNAILSLYNIRCEPTDGKVNGREYHGYVYHATNDKGETIATPFKASRLGKFASRTAVEGMFERAKDKIDIKPTKRIVVDVMARSNGKEDFITNLKEKGIDLILRYNPDGRLYGATFVDHNTQTVLNGSRLGKEFSANALNTWFNDPAQKPIVQQQPSQGQQQSAPTQPQSSHSQSNSGSQGDSQQTSSQGSTQFSTQSQTSQKSSTPRHSNNDDYSQPTLPGLELFHVGSGYDPEQEAMNREMERRKRKKRRKGRRL